MCVCVCVCVSDIGYNFERRGGRGGGVVCGGNEGRYLLIWGMGNVWPNRV